MRRRLVFADRAEAGALLAEKLAQMALAGPLVLALPRGGVPVGAEIARRLGAPLDVALVRKLGSPDEPELAIGAVAEGEPPEIALNTELVAELGIAEELIRAQVERELGVIAERRLAYAGTRAAIEVAGRAVIVVDDGLATGMTMLAALRAVRRRGPARLIAAAPVASRQGAALLEGEADEVVCLSLPRRFASVGAFYRSFTQVSDAEVVALLQDARARLQT